MSDDIVDRARAALDGVTPGPWRLGSWGDNVFGTGPNDEWLPVCRVKRDDSPIEESQDGADARFIAAARSLVPDMADRIDALEAENARLREALRRIVSTSQAMSADYICNGGESGHERTARIAFAALTPEASHD